MIAGLKFTEENWKQISRLVTSSDFIAQMNILQSTVAVFNKQVTESTRPVYDRIDEISQMFTQVNQLFSTISTN
ncbi:hypothetical protein SAMN04488123_10444 [Natribacillus halophilus]|uniref:Uncharacterized protein n=1 Tax=Natribacillus halophilus TaxID=549003 RepID=A0A1G8M9D0_9BACI|nr:hypothetical protein SAMN04488123_10444 [Natribacillus halophilus]